MFLYQQAAALAQERERELAQRDELIRVLTQTRDQAFATLQRHGLAIPTQLPNKEEQLEDSSRDVGKPRHFPPEEKIKELEAQNSNLRSVIKQMRQDMENLGNEFAARPSSTMGQRRDSEKGSPVPLTKGKGVMQESFSCMKNNINTWFGTENETFWLTELQNLAGQF